MLNKGMHKPNPLFYMDIVVQFIFLFNFISRLTIQTFFGWVDFFFISLFYFTFFYVFLFFMFSWNPNMHCAKAFIPNNRERFMKTHDIEMWHFFSFSSSFDHFVPVNNGKLHSLLFCYENNILIWIKKARGKTTFFFIKNIIEVE